MLDNSHQLESLATINVLLDEIANINKMECHITRLPTELLVQIATYLQGQSFTSFRSTCREIENATFKVLLSKRLVHRHVPVTQQSIQKLERLLGERDYKYCKILRTVIFEFPADVQAERKLISSCLRQIKQMRCRLERRPIMNYRMNLAFRGLRFVKDPFDKNQHVMAAAFNSVINALKGPAIHAIFIDLPAEVDTSTSDISQNAWNILLDITCHTTLHVRFIDNANDVCSEAIYDRSLARLMFKNLSAQQFTLTRDWWFRFPHATSIHIYDSSIDRRNICYLLRPRFIVAQIYHLLVHNLSFVDIDNLGNNVGPSKSLSWKMEADPSANWASLLFFEIQKLYA